MKMVKVEVKDVVEEKEEVEEDIKNKINMIINKTMMNII